MGYLDNSTIVVDAILTKHGRKLLATGQGLNISYFTVSDTGIDYSLWNPDHPSGSAFYGEAIENLPNLEALPNAAYFMRNNLITLDREVKKLPYVTVAGAGIGQTATHNFGAGNEEINPLPHLIEFSETIGWQLIVPDSTILTVTGWQSTAISGNAQQYLNDQEIQNVTVYEKATPGGVDASGLKITRQGTSGTRSITITFISKSTGAYKHMNITMDAYP